jgi:hypothetical protein
MKTKRKPRPKVRIKKDQRIVDYAIASAARRKYSQSDGRYAKEMRLLLESMRLCSTAITQGSLLACLEIVKDPGTQIELHEIRTDLHKVLNKIDKILFDFGR